MPRKRWSLLLSAVLPLGLIGACQDGNDDASTTGSTPTCEPAPPPPPYCPLPSGDAFCSLNQAFLDAYSERRAAILEVTDPRIAQVGDLLVLFYKGQRYEGPAVTQKYHEYKVIAHIPFAVYLMLLGTDGAIDAAKAKDLETYRALIVDTTKGIDTRFSGMSLTRQQKMLAEALAFIDNVIAQESVTPTQLTDFVRSQEPNIQLNVEASTRDQIDTTHATIEGWKMMMTAEDLEKLHVVAAVSHMARPGNVALQYFSVMLGEPYEGRYDDENIEVGARLYAAEALFDEKRAFALLGTHVLDRKAGVDFFQDELRMDRDLLADAAEQIIAEKFNKLPDPPPMCMP